MRTAALLVVCAALVASCGSEGGSPDSEEAPVAAKLDVKSPAFAREGSIPAKYTADGADVSPALTWSAGPAGTVSYALVSDDPDAPGGTWVHWVAWNLAPGGLPENVRPDAQIPGGGVQGRNSFGRQGYGGPSPPSGTHRYYFKVYALDRKLDLGPDADKAKLLDAMRGHVLAQGETMGRYSRR